MAAEADLWRLRGELVSLREQIGRESSTVARKRKFASDARARAGRSKSASTILSKLREADRHEAAALAAEKKRAGLCLETTRQDSDHARTRHWHRKHRERSNVSRRELVAVAGRVPVMARVVKTGAGVVRHATCRREVPGERGKRGFPIYSVEDLWYLNHRGALRWMNGIYRR